MSAVLNDTLKACNAAKRLIKTSSQMAHASCATAWDHAGEKKKKKSISNMFRGTLRMEKITVSRTQVQLTHRYIIMTTRLVRALPEQRRNRSLRYFYLSNLRVCVSLRPQLTATLSVCQLLLDWEDASDPVWVSLWLGFLPLLSFVWNPA